MQVILDGAEVRGGLRGHGHPQNQRDPCLTGTQLMSVRTMFVSDHVIHVHHLHSLGSKRQKTLIVSRHAFPIEYNNFIEFEIVPIFLL